jgi:hypothetical protein
MSGAATVLHFTMVHLGGAYTSHDDSPGHQHSWVLSRYDLIIEALT